MANRGPLARAVLFAAVAVCLSVAGLTGCGSGESNGPKVLPSLSGHPSPSASLPAVPTLGPSPSVEEIKASAEAFVRRYVAVLNLTASHPERLSQLAAITAPNCKVCQADLSGRRHLAEKGHHLEGHGYRIESISVDAPEGLATTASLMVAVPGGRIIDNASHEMVEAVPSAAARQVGLSLVYTAGHWTVVDVVLFPG